MLICQLPMLLCDCESFIKESYLITYLLTYLLTKSKRKLVAVGNENEMLHQKTALDTATGKRHR